ncbi:MAG: DegV family protein [Chloroflexi bacterium]|nr:DegV family protein [Chloroflexota bacterium]
MVKIQIRLNRRGGSHGGKGFTDSTSDLTPNIAGELGITVVPLNVHFGSETYRDGVDLTTEDFYRRLSQCKTLPTTSAPAPGTFAEVYDKLAKQTNEILTITISSKLSATYKAAVDGKEMSKSKVRIEVIDSLSAIVGLGLIVISAAKAARAGASLDDVIDVVYSSMNRVDFRMAFDTLEYLRRGGRIGTARAFLGSALKVNPILIIRDGITEGVTRVRTRAKAIDYLCDFVTSFPDVEDVAIEDAATPDEAKILAERLYSRFSKDRIYWMKISPVIGTHVGPHVLGVGVLPK